MLIKFTCLEEFCMASVTKAVFHTSVLLSSRNNILNISKNPIITDVKCRSDGDI